METKAIASKASYARLVLSGAFSMVVAKGVNVSANLAAIVILARLIPPDEFGLFAIAGLIISLGNTLSEGTFALPLVQRESITRSHIQTAFWVSVLASILMVGVVALAAPRIESFFRFEHLGLIMLGIAPVLVFKSGGSVAAAVLQRNHRFGAITATMVATQIVGYLIPTVFLALQGYGVWSLVVGQVVASALEAILLCWFSRCPVTPMVDPVALRHILSFGGFVTMSRLANWGALQIDNIVIGRVLGAEALGLYSRSYNLLAVATSVLGDTAFRALLPAFSRMQGDQVRLAAGFRRSLGIAVPLYAFVSGIPILHAEPLVRLVLGPHWLEATAPLQLLFLAFIARAGYKFSESVLLARGRPGQAALRQSVYCALIGLAALAGSKVGISGVAACVSIAIWGFYITSLSWVHKTLKVGWGWLVVLHIRAVVLAVLAACVDFAIRDSLILTSYWMAHALGMLSFCCICIGAAVAGPAWLVGFEVRDLRRLLFGLLDRRSNRSSA